MYGLRAVLTENIGFAKTYDFCILAWFAFTHVLLPYLQICILLSDIKHGNRQNIRKKNFN